MSEVTAEMIERGRGPDADRSARRRRLAARLQEARERLTSAGSGHRAFDLELMRMYAESRQGAMLPLSLLALGTAGMLTVWVPPIAALSWVSLVIFMIVLLAGVARRFLADTRASLRLAQWQRRFVAAEAVQGLTWGLTGTLVLSTAERTPQTFTLFVLSLVGGMTAMIASPLPVALYAALSPMTLGIALFVRPGAIVESLPLLVIAGAAQFYYIVMARRLYSISLATLSFQAEKDALIVELEQAKLNSDEARRRAEEASLAKSRFLATMSHELRTPLNAILGFSEVMKGELFGTHSVPVYRDYSADIHSSGQHLLMLINEILDLSRVEAGRYELKEEPVTLAHLVEECRHLLDLRARKRDIVISELCEKDLPRIWADERAIRQVVLNLLSNAIKFTPQGGTITIKVGWTGQGGQYVSIRDTGPGIPESEIPVVMSSFGRGTLAQKNAEEGSGLGLPIVKGLVELHGGSFILKSKVREGTEAIVILPPERIIDALPQINPEEPDPRPARGRRAVRPAA